MCFLAHGNKDFSGRNNEKFIAVQTHPSLPFHRGYRLLTGKTPLFHAVIKLIKGNMSNV